MAKARASGTDAVHLIAKETTYGTPVSGAAGQIYRRMPLRSYSLGAEQPLEEDPVWNRSRPEASDPAEGNKSVTGDIVLPMDSRGVGFALMMALGAAETTLISAGLYEHVFLSGKDLFSFASQIGHPKLTVPKWRTHTGVKIGGMQFPMARNGRAVMTLPLIAQGEIKDTGGTPQRDTNPLIFDYLPFNNARGSIKVGGAALANVTAGQFNYSNGLEPVETIRPDMMIDGVDDGIRSLGGSVDVRYGSDSTLDDLADTNTPAAMEYGFKIGSKPPWGLTFEIPRVFFPLTKKPITGPGGIAATANWMAAYDQTAGYLLKVTLRNDVASYA